MSRRDFFRQSGWMTVATVGGGVFNTASSFIAQRMPEGELDTFETALAAVAILGIPAAGVQAAFASQAAAADADAPRRALAAAMRGVLSWLAVIWIVVAVGCLLGQKSLMTRYAFTQPVMLWLIVGICLITLLTPVPFGVLQGRQDFAWYGSATMLNGIGRFVVLFVVVKILGFGAFGAVAGVTAGSLLVLALVAWRSRDAFRLAGGHFEWRGWLRRLVPVTLGLGALIFIMQADALVMRDKIKPLLTANESDGYYAVRKIALALVFVVGALVSVMYPKVSRSFQRAEKSDALGLTVGLTALIGVAGATVATIFPELPLRLLSPGRLLESKILVPGFCWALVPLALSNVLGWSLLARECYRAVPWMLAVAAGYWWALHQCRDRQSVILTLGLAGTALLLVCALFLWLQRRASQRSAT